MPDIAAHADYLLVVLVSATVMAEDEFDCVSLDHLNHLAAALTAR